YGHGACVEQDDKGWDARKRAYCLKIQPATGSFARNLIYSTKPCKTTTVIKPYCKKPGDNSIVCNRAHYAVFQRVSLIWDMRLNEMKTRHGQRIQEDINGR
ncbi:hypothetical protein GB874_15610, partial [Klebsiella pneumoniae]